jgi:cytochrome P450
MANLRNELDPVVNKEQPFELENVQNLPYLNGFINEVLRYDPPDSFRPSICSSCRRNHG